MEPNLLLTTEQGIAQLFDSSWSFTRGTMAVAQILKHWRATGEQLFDSAFIVYGNKVYFAEIMVSTGVDVTQITFSTPVKSVPDYVVRYMS